MPSGKTIEQKIADWESKLIDLSLSNRLINYKMTKSSTIVIKEPDLKNIFIDLALERKTLSLICEKVRDDIREDPSGGRECGLLNNVSLSSDIGIPSTLNPNTEKALRNLRTRSNLIRRESGIESLYITFGRLDWKDEKGETHMAPLVLVPVKISKKGLIAPYTLQAAGDDVILNPALALKVKKEMNVDLPGLPEDLDGFDLPFYLGTLATVLKRREGWTVDIGAPMLGLFMFAKVVIYQDMKAGADQIRWHPLIRALGGDISQLPQAKSAGPAGELDPLSTYQILETDSSQEEAVEAVKGGESLVLIGPPGTGKSQTIANIIAESLAAGKTVLFVAEKMAALDVVKRRLASCGLDDFCLELHSGSPVKQEVLDSILRPLETTEQRTDGLEEFKLNQLKTVRDELVAYAAMLHRPQGAMGMSAYDAYGEMASLSDRPQLVFDVPDPLSFSRERMDKAEALIQRLVASKQVLADKESHPWRDCDLRELGPAEQADLIVRLEDVQKEIERLLAISSQFCKKIEMSDPKTIEAMRRFSSLMSAAGGSPLPPRNWFAKGEAGRLLDIGMKLLTAKGDSRSGEAYILTRYKKEFLDFDGAAYAERFERDYRGFLRMFNSGFRKDMQAIRSMVLAGKVGYKEVRHDLITLRKLQRANALLADVEKNGREWFGRYYEDIEKDSGPMISALRWTKTFSEMPGYEDAWVKAVAEDTELREDVVRDGPVALKSMKDMELALDSARSLFVDKLISIDGSTELVKLKYFATSHINARSKLAEWVELKGTERALRVEGLGPLYDEVLKRQPLIDELRPAFRKRFFQLWLQELHLKESGLGGFNSTEHMDKVARYKQLDQESREITRARLRKVLLERVRAKRMNADERWRKEEGYIFGLKGRRKLPAVRDIVANCPTVLGTVKPCFMMSPISVSQFLPSPNGSPLFDLVIFDEASQIVPEDAICCISRGKQLVVVGDNRQLPPTRFFDKIAEDTDEELEDLESILDECGTIGLKQKMLLWHYRSRQESLISFSNMHLYGGKLITTPSAEPSKEGEGVEMVYVKNGVYDRGGERNNPIEAGVVADTIIDQYLKHPEMTLGVVAFSQAQQEEVLDKLEYKLKTASIDKPELAHLLDDEGAEPFFVKNLENVQGDERDVMIFSIGYGKDDKGTMTLNFGPLNQEGGARRLNVAVTRARRYVKVISSIRSGDIQVGEKGPQGVVLLKEYLAHAESKGTRVALTPHEIELSRSKLEGALAAALTERGYQIARNIGTSSVRVDIAIADPSRKGAYILGILCDGSSYMAGRNARDREIIREGVLKGLGWKTVRVWSRDLSLDRERTIERLTEAIEAAKREQRP